MKNIRYLLFTMIMLFSYMFCVQASCTDEELSTLKKKADDIKITYKHLGYVELEDGNAYYDRFDVNIKNVSDDFYIMFYDEKLVPTEGVIKETMVTGSWNLMIYSNRCETQIDEIKFRLPRFNLYSMDPLCDGIDGDDFALCGKYYEYDVDYDNFVARVKYYRTIHNITSDGSDSDSSNNIFNLIFKYMSEYQIYIIVSLAVVLLILFIIITLMKRKKRGVLE